MSATTDRRDAVIAILRAVREMTPPADGGDAWSDLNDRFHEIEALYDARQPPSSLSDPTQRPYGGGEHGPAWRAFVDTDAVRHALILQAGRERPDGGVEHLSGLIPDGFGIARPIVERGDEMGPPPGTRGLMVPVLLAVALYHALAQHFGGTLDARTARADFEHERAARELLVGDVVTLAGRLADVATAAVARNNVTVFGAADVVNSGALGPEPRSFTYGPGAARPNLPRPDDVVDTRR